MRDLDNRTKLIMLIALIAIMGAFSYYDVKIDDTLAILITSTVSAIIGITIDINQNKDVE